MNCNNVKLIPWVINRLHTTTNPWGSGAYLVVVEELGEADRGFISGIGNPEYREHLLDALLVGHISGHHGGMGRGVEGLKQHVDGNKPTRIAIQ